STPLHSAGSVSLQLQRRPNPIVHLRAAGGPLQFRVSTGRPVRPPRLPDARAHFSQIAECRSSARPRSIRAEGLKQIPALLSFRRVARKVNRTPLLAPLLLSRERRFETSAPAKTSPAFHCCRRR